MDENPDVAIVDDDDSVRMALGGLLRSAGFSIRVFASAEAFLAADEMRAFRCLIVDWRMPGMDGLQLQRHMVVIGCDIPTIILTVHGDEASRAQALRAGAIAFLPKPFYAGALLAAVGVALEGPRRPLTPRNVSEA